MIGSKPGRGMTLALLLAVTAGLPHEAAAQTDEAGVPKGANATDRQGQGPVDETRDTPGRVDDRLRFRVGVTPRYISNYFQTQDDFLSGSATADKESVTVTTLAGEVEYDLVTGSNSSLTAGARIRRNLFHDLDGANSTDLDATLSYKFQPSEVRLGVFRTPRRLVSNSGGNNIYSKTNGFNVEYLTRPSRRLRTRAEYQYARETFSAFAERDVDRHLLSADVRYQIDPLFTPGIGFEYLRGKGRSDNFSYRRPALVLVANSRISDIAYLTFRYRHSRRKFTTDTATDSNFGRIDRRGDLSLYGTTQLGKGFELFGFASRTRSNSNRDARDFTGYETGLGLFFNF